MAMVARLEAWDIQGADFPAAGRAADQLEFLLRYAILAPSTRNSQPWLFKVRPNAVEVYADRTRGLPVSDPDDHQLTISCGAAVCTLELALRRFGHAGAVSVLPRAQREDLIAEVGLGQAIAPTDADVALFDAIAARHTNRARFEDVAFPDEVLQDLQAAAAREGAWLAPLTGDAKQTACEFVAEADRIQHKDKRFRRELASWLVPNRGDRRDGVPGYAVGFSNLMSHIAPFRIRTFDTGDASSAHAQALAQGSPLLAVLGTEGDDPWSWIATGRALQRTLLTATSHGYDASFLNQATEVEHLRPKLGELTGHAGFPHMLIRFGNGPQTTPTPRRLVEDMRLGAAAWI